MFIILLLFTLQNYFHPLTISHYLIKEKDYIPWAAANSALNYLDIVLSGSSVYPFYQVCRHEKLKIFAGHLTSNDLEEPISVKSASLLHLNRQRFPPTSL